jgi:transcriptional regulator with XRE-family HTH domain
MELFERVRYLARLAKDAGDSLAEQIGVNQNTFNGYLSLKRQDNLWPLLDKMLALHPKLSRNWLYFGEPPIVTADNPDNETQQRLLDELGHARQRVIDLEGQIAALHTALEAQSEALAAHKALSASLQHPIPSALQKPAQAALGKALPKPFPDF